MRSTANSETGTRTGQCPVAREPRPGMNFAGGAPRRGSDIPRGILGLGGGITPEGALHATPLIDARQANGPYSSVTMTDPRCLPRALHRRAGVADQSLDVRAHAGPFLFHWLSVDRWRPLRSAAGCSRTLPGGGVRRRGRRGWHVIAKCEDGNSGHHDPDDKCRQEPSAAVSVTERSLSVGVQAWIGLLRLSVGRLAIDHLFPLPVVGPTRL